MDGWPCADGGRDEIFWDFAGRLRSGTNVNARLGDGAVTEGKADNRFRTNEIHAPAMRCGGKQFLSPGNMAAKNKAVLEGEFIMGKSSSRFLRSGSAAALALRSEEHTSELQSLMRISYAVFCLKKKKV